MFYLALYPILRIYLFLPGLSWGDMLFFWLIAAELYRKKGKIRLSYPQYYKAYWIYIACSYLVVSYFKPAAFIPGGWSFFIYSIILGYVILKFDYEAFKKYYRFVFVISLVIFLLQEIMFYSLGYRFHALLPFGRLLDGFSMSELIVEHQTGLRSSSFFREPAHLAQYVLPLLIMELFDHEGRDKICNKYAVAIVLMLLFLRSGNGMLGLLIVLAIKFAHYIYSKEIKYKVFKIIIAGGILVIPIMYYMGTEAAQLMVFRSAELQNEEESASYIRIYRGYALYGELPAINKLIGINEDDLVERIPKTSISYLFTGERISDVYCNCIQYILIYSGFLGFLFVALVYFKLFKNARIMGRTSILLLFTISLVASIYNSYLMF